MKVGARISTVSKRNERVYEHIENWRNRPIQMRFPHVYLDMDLLRHHL